MIHFGRACVTIRLNRFIGDKIPMAKFVACVSSTRWV